MTAMDGSGAALVRQPGGRSLTAQMPDDRATGAALLPARYVTESVRGA